MDEMETHVDLVHDISETSLRKTIVYRAVNWLEGTLDAIARSPNKTVQVQAAKWLRTQIIDENQKLHISPTTWMLFVFVIFIWFVAVPYTFYVALQS